MGTDKERIVAEALRSLLSGAKQLVGSNNRSAAVLLKELCLKAISTGYKPERFQEAWELLDLAGDLRQVVELVEGWIKEERR